MERSGEGSDEGGWVKVRSEQQVPPLRSESQVLSSRNDKS
jgi:hypothetical protein